MGTDSEADLVSICLSNELCVEKERASTRLSSCMSGAKYPCLGVLPGLAPFNCETEERERERKTGA